eukprot:UC4_evm3s461
MGLNQNPEELFHKLSSRYMEKTDDDFFTMDDMFEARASRKTAAGKEETRRRQKAESESRRQQESLARDPLSLENFPKHMLVCLGVKAYLALAPRGSLTEGHCIIVPVTQSPSVTALDDDVYDEMCMFMRCVSRMFRDMNYDVIFMETAMGFRRHPHTCIECIPLEGEAAEIAPMCFKKAIQECDVEWSQHKKVIDTKGKGIRHSVPKGFAYFHVSFGDGDAKEDLGFAHVIEDEELFPRHFGKEIIGNLVGAMPSTWLRPPKESFTVQKKRVETFAKMWKDYDWTVDML